MGSTRSLAATAVLLVFLATAFISTARGSKLMVFSGPGCTGRTKLIGCGCHNLTGYQGGFRFKYTDDDELVMYETLDCAPDDYLYFTYADRNRCNKFPYRSVSLTCRLPSPK